MVDANRDILLEDQASTEIEDLKSVKAGRLRFVVP